jgi:hypothetical protein
MRSTRTTSVRIAVGALAAASTLALVAAAPASAAGLTQGKARGVTTVTLDAGTVGALGGLGLSLGVLRPAGSDLSVLKVAFPITGNAKSGVVSHTGGLSFSAEGTTVTLTNYQIDLGSGVLSANAAVNGDSVGRIGFLDLGSAPADPACDASASLTLNEDAAGALTAVFEAPDLTGAPVGVGCVDFR